MTNESIFYIIGLILGGVIGYAIRMLRVKTQIIKVVIHPKKGADNEQREAD